MRAAALLVLLSLASACERERATVRILGATATRLPDRRLAVDVDVEAHEGLGGNLGRYCVGVAWPFVATFDNQCASDLEDGDTKSLHFVSERTDHPAGLIRVRAFTSVETGALDIDAPP